MATPSSSSLRLTSRTSSPSSSEFVQFTATMRLPIPPVFSINSNGNQELSGSGTGTGGDGGMEGVKEVLAGWVMRYLPPLHAVVLSFDSNPRFLHPEALFDANACPFETNLPSSSSLLPSPPPTPPTNSNGNKTTAAGYDEEEKKKLEEGELVRLKTLPMIDGSGFTLADVEWKGLGWAPRVGMKLVGTPTLSTSSHVSLLLHNLFNASIPSSHIPQDLYEFDPSCPVPAVVLERRQQTPKPTKSLEELAEASKKTQREALGIEGDDAEDSDGDDEDKEDIKMDEEEEEEGEFEEQGWWVDKKTRQPLGGQQGRIEFTLVSLSTSNSLLSCTGSLLSDPFTPSGLASLSDPSSTSSTSSSALLQAQTIRSGHSQSQPRLSDDSDSDSDSNSSDSDEDGGEAASGDDDDGVGTGIPLHQGAPSKTEDPSKSDSEDSDDSSSSSESDASSRSPSPEPVPEKKGKRTKAEKKGKPPVVGSSKVETKVVPTTTTVTEEKAAKKDKKEKKRKEAGSPEKGTERKSKKSRKE